MEDYDQAKRSFDKDYTFNLAKRLSNIGLYSLGFRPAGSPAEREASELIASEMLQIGLKDVRIEEFQVDGWEFEGASIKDLESGSEFELVAYAPSVGTGEGSYEARLVYAGDGSLERIISLDVQGSIALLEMDFSEFPRLSYPVRQLEQRGALAVIVFNVNTFAQEEEALHANDLTFKSSVPVLSIRRREGLSLKKRLLAGEQIRVRLNSTARRLENSKSGNVIGVIPGQDGSRRLIVGDHYDAWFSGFMDCAAGSAVMIALAKALIDCNYKPRYDLFFVAHGAEEYGTWHSSFDWLIGAHACVSDHRDWVGTTRAYLNLELLGYPPANLLEIATTPELRGFVENTLGELGSFSGYPVGFRVRTPPFCWSDDWIYAAAGIPTLVNWWGGSDYSGYMETIYHTQFDSEARFDEAKIMGTGEAFLALILAIDRSPIAPLDIAARLLDFSFSFPYGMPEGLRPAWRECLVAYAAFSGAVHEALEKNDEAGLYHLEGRLLQAEVVLQGGLMALGGEVPRNTCYPHEGLMGDIASINAALSHLRTGYLEEAVEVLKRVRSMSWGRKLSEEVYKELHLEAYNKSSKSWGEKRVVPYIDVYRSYHNLLKAGKTGMPVSLREIEDELVSVRRHAEAHLDQAIEKEIISLRKASEILRV